MSNLVFIVGGIILLWTIIVWGITTASKLLLPVLTVASAGLILGFLAVILPLSLLKQFRPRLGLISMVMSHILGATTWMMSFLYVIEVLGNIGILLAFLFKLLAPLALIGMAYQAKWQMVAALGLWIIFAYAMRFYGMWLLSNNSPKQNSSRKKRDSVIDVEGHTVE